MTTQTDRLKLNKPAEGDTDWAAEINENWDILDEAAGGLVSAAWRYDLSELQRANVAVDDTELAWRDRETVCLRYLQEAVTAGDDESTTYETMPIDAGSAYALFHFKQRKGRVLRASMQAFYKTGTPVSAGTCDLQIGFATDTDVNADGDIDTHDWSGDVLQIDTSDQNDDAYLDPADGPSGSFEFDDLSAIECRLKKSLDLAWTGTTGCVAVELLVEVNPCFWLPVREDGLELLEFTACIPDNVLTGDSEIKVYPVYRQEPLE